MANDIVVTKSDDTSFKVQFSKPVGPGNVAPGQTVPIEWLTAALNYYSVHKQSDGSLSDTDTQRIIGFW
jgi:hypothetical protein